jgi:hypothetical protein
MPLIECAPYFCTRGPSLASVGAESGLSAGGTPGPRRWSLPDPCWSGGGREQRDGKLLLEYGRVASQPSQLHITRPMEPSKVRAP